MSESSSLGSVENVVDTVLRAHSKNPLGGDKGGDGCRVWCAINIVPCWLIAPPRMAATGRGQPVTTVRYRPITAADKVPQHILLDIRHQGCFSQAFGSTLPERPKLRDISARGSPKHPAVFTAEL